MQLSNRTERTNTYISEHMRYCRMCSILGGMTTASTMSENAKKKTYPNLVVEKVSKVNDNYVSGLQELQ